jgi:putative molybdopterin biosynthesis protein
MAAADLVAAVRRAASQEQFLEVVSSEEAHARFARHIDLSPLPGEVVALDAALGRVLAHDVVAPIDVPPFDRSGVDGFAVRAADTANATDGSPRRLLLNYEVIACGHQPKLEVGVTTATTISTGGALPRGADAVVMNGRGFCSVWPLVRWWCSPPSPSSARGPSPIGRDRATCS